MRSLYKEGLLFYITNEFQTEFIAAQLSQGRLVVSYDDSGIMKDMMIPNELDDGLWHEVREIFSWWIDSTKLKIQSSAAITRFLGSKKSIAL